MCWVDVDLGPFDVVAHNAEKLLCVHHFKRTQIYGTTYFAVADAHVSISSVALPSWQALNTHSVGQSLETHSDALIYFKARHTLN